MLMTIFLDMDGVLTDFHGDVFRLFGKTTAEVLPTWPEIKIGYGKKAQQVKYPFLEYALHMEARDMWHEINGEGEEFWSEMTELPWAKELYRGCCDRADTYILSSPSWKPNSLSGKIKWLFKFTGNKHFRKYLIGPDKYLCARRGAVLVDDTMDKVNPFIDHGGDAILVPQPWNTAWNTKYGEPTSDDILPHVFGELDKLIK